MKKMCLLSATLPVNLSRRTLRLLTRRKLSTFPMKNRALSLTVKSSRKILLSTSLPTKSRALSEICCLSRIKKSCRTSLSLSETSFFTVLLSSLMSCSIQSKRAKEKYSSLTILCPKFRRNNQSWPISFYFWSVWTTAALSNKVIRLSSFRNTCATGSSSQ